MTQIIGYTVTNIAEVEAATKALRITARPCDALGEYMVAGNSGIMAAGFTAPGTIWSFMWSSATKNARVRRIAFSAGNNGTAFTADSAAIFLVKAHSFTVADTGGTSLIPAAGMNKKRTSMPDSVVGDIRISSTAALTAGTRFAYGDGLYGAGTGLTATAGDPMFTPVDMFDAPPGEQSIILTQNEGLLLMLARIGPTGTWKFGVKVEWAEVAA